MKNSEDNVIITWNLNAKLVTTTALKTDQLVIVLKKALNDADLSIADNNIPLHQDNRTKQI